MRIIYRDKVDKKRATCQINVQGYVDTIEFLRAEKVSISLTCRALLDDVAEQIKQQKYIDTNEAIQLNRELRDVFHT